MYVADISVDGKVLLEIMDKNKSVSLNRRQLYIIYKNKSFSGHAFLSKERLCD